MPFSKCRYLIINRIAKLERTLEADQFESHFIDGGCPPREGKGPNLMEPPHPRPKP